MTAGHGALRDRLECLGVETLLLPARVLPARAALAGMAGLSRIIQLAASRRRRHAAGLVEQRLGLPAGSPEVRRIVAGSFRTLALNLYEPPLLEAELARGRPLDELVTVEGAEHMRDAQAAGPGVLCCSAHIGAWESVALVIKELFGPIWLVARELDNPLLEARLASRRRRWSRGTIPKDGGALPLVRALRAGEPVGIVLDQNAGSQGAILDFLGAPASHHTVAGVMARRFGVPCVPLYLLREPGCLRFRMRIEPAIVADPRAGDARAIELDVTRRLSASVARIVREHPEQWLWLHDRWRHAALALRREARRAAAGEVGTEGRTQVTTAQGTNGP
jgi:KDO2-lipid IV(A) lauroyltransferase